MSIVTKNFTKRNRAGRSKNSHINILFQFSEDRPREIEIILEIFFCL